MSTVRLENTTADFQRRGLDPDNVAVWEDGRRDDDRAGAMEWWYFDAIMDDGTKATIHFHSKQPTNSGDKVAHPQAGLLITLPDGTVYRDEPFVTPSEVFYAADRCDVHYGPHWVTGDLKRYDLHFENRNGIGADLTIESLTSPWRPGTAYYDFGDGTYFTWLCVVPKGRITGTLTYNGQTVNVTGFAYHDHQWLTINSMQAINHWLWGRQAIGEDYTVLNFDIVTSKKHNYQRLPMFVIQDRDGKVIFECTDPNDMQCEILDEYHGEGVGKDYPKQTHYVYQSEGKTAEYTVTADRENYVADVFAELPDRVRQRLGSVLGTIFGPAVAWATQRKLIKQGLRPSYANYSATGHLILKDADGTVLVDRATPLIYEFVYMGLEYRPHMETAH